MLLLPGSLFFTLVVLTAVFYIHLFSIGSMCQEPKQKGHEKSGWHAMAPLVPSTTFDNGNAKNNHFVF